MSHLKPVNPEGRERGREEEEGGREEEGEGEREGDRNKKMDSCTPQILIIIYKVI